VALRSYTLVPTPHTVAVISYSMSSTVNLHPQLIEPVVHYLLHVKHDSSWSFELFEPLSEVLHTRQVTQLADALDALQLSPRELLRASRFAHRQNACWVDVLEWLLTSVLSYSKMAAAERYQLFHEAFLEDHNYLLTRALSARGQRLENESQLLNRPSLHQSIPLEYVWSR